MKKLQIVNQTRERMIQFLKNKTKTFQEIGKNSLKNFYQEKDSVYLNEWIVTSNCKTYRYINQKHKKSAPRNARI